MYKAFKALILMTLITACFAVPVSAAGITEINGLIENAAAFNNQTVTVQGEAIGEALDRGEYAWVNINDGTNAIGIWLKSSDAETITYFGDYKHIGDTVRIIGIFSRDCSEHGGDVDVHCSSIEIIKKGHPVNEEVSFTKVSAAAILFCAALIVAYIYFRMAKKSKQQYNVH